MTGTSSFGREKARIKAGMRPAIRWQAKERR
jgi:hypothetical protein